MLGSGGTDLASKYQILAYFEKVLKKLEGTGQLEFYPQCRYNGEGRFTSVLDPELEYVVDVKRKVVDASYLTTKVSSVHPDGDYQRDKDKYYGEDQSPQPTQNF